MSRPLKLLDRDPLIGMVERATRALKADMVETCQAAGFSEMRSAHNAVFASLPPSGARAAELARRAGMTRQSMGEVIRDLVGLGILEMVTDPSDRRAKIVTYTPYGIKIAGTGYQHLMDLESRYAEEFGEDDYQTARRVIERVTEMLGGDRTLP